MHVVYLLTLDIKTLASPSTPVANTLMEIFTSKIETYILKTLSDTLKKTSN